MALTDISLPPGKSQTDLVEEALEKLHPEDVTEVRKVLSRMKNLGEVLVGLPTEHEDMLNMPASTWTLTSAAPVGGKRLVQNLWEELSAPLQASNRRRRWEAYQAMLLMLSRLDKHYDQAGSKEASASVYFEYHALLLNQCKALSSADLDRPVTDVSPPGVHSGRYKQRFVDSSRPGSYWAMLTEEVREENDFVTERQNGITFCTREKDEYIFGNSKESLPYFNPVVSPPNQIEDPLPWRHFIEGLSFLVDMYAQNVERATRTGRYIGCRKAILQAVLYQFDLYGQVAQHPSVGSPAVTERSADYYRAALDLRDKEFETESVSTYFGAMAQRAPKADGECPTWQAVGHWAIENGHYETNSGMTLTDVRRSIETEAESVLGSQNGEVRGKAK